MQPERIISWAHKSWVPCHLGIRTVAPKISGS